jgi:hypothetical protein
MQYDNAELFHKHLTWREFEKEIHCFVGNLPRIFEMIDDDMILTPGVISEMIDVHVESVRRWCRQGKLTVISPVGCYRITGYDFKEFIYCWWRSEFIKSYKDKTSSV